MLRVVSGKERKVKEYLDKEIARGGWGNIVKQVFLPVEKVYKVQNGKKVMRERNYYPGYVMIEIGEGKLSDDLRDTIKNTTNVIHFLGKENPIALRRAEVNKMLGKMDEMAVAGGVSMSEPFIVGETIKIIEGIKNLMLKHKKKIRENTKFYSQDIINNLFNHPYTKIDFIMADLDVSRITATKYLDELDLIGIVQKVKLGRDNYYINTDLYNLLSNVNQVKHV